MSHSKRELSAKPITFLSILPQAILGMIVGGIFGFVVASEVSPWLLSLFIKPSIFIPDPAVIFYGLLILGVGTLGGALGGMVFVLWLSGYQNRTQR
jgi:hypothetical protein